MLKWMKDILKQKHSNFTPRNILNRSVYLYSSKNKCNHIHSNFIPNNQNRGQSKCSSVLLQKNKLYIQTMEHYTAMRKNSLQLYTATWSIKLKNNVERKKSDVKIIR